MAKKPAKKSSAISVDFTGVESGSSALPEDDYLFEVTEVTKETSESSGSDYLKLEFEVADGEFKGRKAFHNCSLQPQALFNLRGVLEALGFEVPDGAMDLDPADMVGETCGASIGHEKYEGKTRGRMVEFFTAEELEERQGAEPAKPTKPAKKGAAKPEPEAPKKVVKKSAKAKEPEFEEGDTVTFEDEDGNELTGEITGVEDDKYTVTVTTGKGKKAKTEDWELDAGDLTKVDQD